MLAAHAAGLTDVVLPERNLADIDDVPAHVREEMTFHPVMSLAEVLDLSLEPSRPPTMSRCRTCAPVPEEVRRAASLLEGRWTVSILYASYEGASRFNEFRQAVGTIPPRTLPSACSTSSRPACWSGSSSTRDRLQVEYRLTETGRRLREVVDALVDSSSRGGRPRARPLFAAVTGATF